jgi:formamidopyrimidine-DNA glycosylase
MGSEEERMPELPDLEVIKEFLEPRLVGQTIAGAEELRPLIVRDLTGEGLAAGVAGRSISAVWRRGKFLIVDLGPRRLVLNPMLAGRLHYAAGGKRRPGTPAGKHRPGYAAAVLRLADGQEVWYTDAKQMGKLYLTDDLDQVPVLMELGPDALDPELTAERFAERIRPYRGEIKGVLTRQPFVAGIGNAYSDEICWRARVYPFRKRTALSAAEIEQVYAAMRAVLIEAIEVLRRRVGEEIHVEIRDFLAVHGKGGQPCPRCGTRISQLKSQDYYANFCRGCQPGTLIRE